jgi:4-amino-4-deoxy-L-arabinose transferase-like glycosyltransferase
VGPVTPSIQRLIQAHTGRAAAALLLLWILAAHTYGDFHAVRTKLLTAPVSGQQSVSLPLATADSRDPYLAVIYRIRNDATTPITIAAVAGQQVLGRASIAAHASKRIDLVAPRATIGEAARTLDLHGSHNRWTLEFVEVANLHGFTRGPVEFVILPRLQSFGPPPAWAWIAWVAWFIVSLRMNAAHWSRWPKRADRVFLAMVAVFLGAVGISPLITPFRIVVSSGTFAGALFLLAVPRAAQALLDRRRQIAAAAAQLGGHADRLLIQLISIGRRVQQRLSFRSMFAVALIGYAILLWVNIGVYAGGADSSGYLNSARLLLEGRITTPVRSLESAAAAAVPSVVYTPLAFRNLGTGVLAPGYPVGLPLLIASLAPVAGLTDAAAILLAAHAVAGVLLIAWLALECGLSRYLAAIAALLLASSPVYLFMTVTLMSDVPALAWTSAAVLMAWRSRRNDAWAGASGAAMAVAVLIRPTNVLVLAPLAVCLGLSIRRWLWLVVGGLPGAILLVAYNRAAYGAIVATGYLELNQHFALAHVLPSLRHYASWLPVVLTPIGVLALGLPALLRNSPRLVTVLMLWIGVFLIFYATYSFTDDTWWYTRFLLPAFPPLLVGSLWAGRAAFERVNAAVGAPALAQATRRVAGAVGGVLLAALIVAHNVSWTRHFHVLGVGRGERRYLEVADWTRSHLPAGAGILAMQASGALFHYTDFPVIRWDMIDGDALRSLTADALSGRHGLYAVLFPVDFDYDVRNRLQGRWVRIGAVADVTIWRFDGMTESVGAVPAASGRWFDSEQAKNSALDNP